MVYNRNQPGGNVSVVVPSFCFYFVFLLLLFLVLIWGFSLRLKTRGALGHIGPYREYECGIITLHVTMQR